MNMLGCAQYNKEQSEWQQLARSILWHKRSHLFITINPHALTGSGSMHLTSEITLRTQLQNGDYVQSVTRSQKNKSTSTVH